MKKTLIHLIAIAGILIMCVGLCRVGHTNPLLEFYKYEKHRRTNFIILLLPFFAVVLLYFILVIDWTVFFQVPVSDTEVIEAAPKQGKTLLPVKDHLTEQKQAEERLREHTERSVAGSKETELQPVKEGEETTLEYFYSSIDKEILNNNPDVVPVTDDVPNIKAVEIAPALPVAEEIAEAPSVFKDGKFTGLGSMEFPADIKAEPSKGTDTTTTEKTSSVEIEEIAAKLPDPLNDYILKNHQNILNNTIVMDEKDRFEIVNYLKNERGFSESAEKLSRLVVDKLETLGKDNLEKQLVASMLESDNPLLITGKKTNSLKERARKQLLENADFQQALFSTAS
ncbi:hypothetical protein [Mucilaginibacter sp. UYCu711]|uniref:hypothetical protein n=1 Tax=Mucilaginibacter sp. UYCu711 TaxID=3156339 RepID=UPI003D239F04